MSTHRTWAVRAAVSTHRTWAVRAATAVVAFLLTGALSACGSASAQDDEPHAQEAASSQSPAPGDSGDAPAETQGEEQSLAAMLLFNGPSHTDTAAPGAWDESGCDAQKQARIIVVRGTEEPAGQSLMSPLASRIAAELGDHAQVSDLESGCDAQKQARIIVVRGTEEPAGQSLMSPLASRIAAELGDHAQVSDLDYPASWESGSEAAGVKQVSDLDYPASWESGSEAAGVNRLIAVLNAQSAQCPAMRTVLLGYSQGAMVVGDALSAPDTRFNEDNGYELSPVARGHIVAVELYGDVSDLDYPASWESGSEAAGVNRLIAVLNAQSAQCPAMRTVLLGYSQGALVVGDALSAPVTRFNEDNGYELSPVARGHIVAVEFYGYPRFRAAAS